MSDKKSDVKKPRRRWVTGKMLREWFYGYLFLLPWVVGVCVFVVFSLVNSFNFSLNSIKIMPRVGMVLTYVGFKNFTDIFVIDMFFVQRLINFTLTLALQVPVIVSFSLMMAMLINGKIKFKGFFRTIFFLPVIIATGPVMNELTSQGVASVPLVNSNAIIGMLSGILPQWLAEPVLSLFSSLILILWNSGVQILIFIAALQKVDPSQYEAAKIDGASGWECFWKITLPVMKPMILLNAMYTIVALAGASNNVIVDLIYTNMFSADRGYGIATAMAWLYTLAILLILGVVYLLLRDKSDKPQKAKIRYYERR